MTSKKVTDVFNAGVNVRLRSRFDDFLCAAANGDDEYASYALQVFQGILDGYSDEAGLTQPTMESYGIIE